MPKLGRRSERTELEYQMAPELVRKDAPFGTNDTPVITMKIIGGRQVPVIEKHPTHIDYVGSRIQPLRPIADKPNHLDPRIHGDNPGGYYNKDVQLEPTSPRPTNFVNKRPDSKDVVRNQFKALPPIQQNRTRNDLSTVFEAEPWTENKNPPLANDTEYKQNYYQGRDLDRNMDNYQQTAAKDHHYVSESDKNRLLMLVPRNVLLPVDPIKLTREQETTLCKLICNELNRFNPKELRDVYVECSQHDKELRGFCGIEILDNNLRRHKAFLSDPLRIIAAQYVDPNYPGKVNYEKVLSFIGGALQLNERGQFPHDSDIGSNDRPKYYMQNGESFKTGSIYRDREIAKLLRMVEQELSKNTYSMDWTRWQNAFYERDRDHRETLSAAQIKDICYDQKLPLSDSLINQILQLCEDNNRDGQYRWHSFLEFLSRVRPSNTGLPIPRRGTSPRRDISPRRGENRPEERYNDRDNYRRNEPETYRERDSYRGGRPGESPRQTKEQRIMQLSQQLRELETKYEITREGLTSNEQPWLDRFLKMAQALYNSDITNKGSLPRKDVLDIVNQYNNAFNLNMDMTRANMLAISPDNLDKSGNIILKNYLASLSAERISYKV